MSSTGKGVPPSSGRTPHAGSSGGKKHPANQPPASSPAAASQAPNSAEISQWKIQPILHWKLIDPGFITPENKTRIDSGFPVERRGGLFGADPEKLICVRLHDELPKIPSDVGDGLPHNVREGRMIQKYCPVFLDGFHYSAAGRANNILKDPPSNDMFHFPVVIVRLDELFWSLKRFEACSPMVDNTRKRFHYNHFWGPLARDFTTLSGYWILVDDDKSDETKPGKDAEGGLASDVPPKWYVDKALHISQDVKYRAKDQLKGVTDVRSLDKETQERLKWVANTLFSWYRDIHDLVKSKGGNICLEQGWPRTQIPNISNEEERNKRPRTLVRPKLVRWSTDSNDEAGNPTKTADACDLFNGVLQSSHASGVGHVPKTFAAPPEASKTYGDGGHTQRDQTPALEYLL